jgi:dihydropteroate synthase
MSFSINIKGTLMQLDTPKIMGIINVTPDSFSDGGQFLRVEDALKQAEIMLQEGADILDIGGYSSRPGAKDVSVEEELDRVIPVIEQINKRIDIPMSIDTFRAVVAREAVNAGAALVNDISAGDDDDAMLETVANLQVPYIAMHKQGKPQTMQDDIAYKDVVLDVSTYLSKKKEQCALLGINDVILDIGLGFGKTREHNFTLIKNLKHFQALGLPLLIGLSRKSIVYKTLGVTPQEAINGTTFLHAFALQGGAHILRVHDVKEAKECVRLWQKLNATG